MAMLSKGLAGEPVELLQKKLGISVDGTFGPNTEAALKKWQEKNGLVVDGIAGPDTFMSMGLHQLVLLKVGTKGQAVVALQNKLGISADGQFGAGTAKALREYQEQNELAADGVAGPATLAHMKLFKEITADTVKMSQVSANQSPADATSKGAAMADAKGPSVRSIWDTIKNVFN